MCVSVSVCVALVVVAVIALLVIAGRQPIGRERGVSWHCGIEVAPGKYVSSLSLHYAGVHSDLMNMWNCLRH